MSTIYEIPSSIEEMFENKHCFYKIINYSNGNDMDNIQSMSHFLESIPSSFNYDIEENEGTRVVLSHPSYKYKIRIDSYGLGDFFSHGFEVSVQL